MKFRHFVASILLFSLVPVAMAEDRPVKASDRKVEVKMRVIKRGDQYVGYHNNREYNLRGDSITRFRGNGDYVVNGQFGSDNTFFDTQELRPVEYRMRVTRRGDNYIGNYDSREFILRGDGAARITKEGEYIAYGEIGPDGTYFETNDITPVVVETRVVEVAPTEYRMRVVRRGDRYVGFYNNREYILRGDSVTRITSDGEYVVHGDIGADGTYFETREVRPVVVVQEAPPQQVIIVKEHRDPFIKLGPLEIGR